MFGEQRRLRIFGSVGRGTATGESDLDLLVEFEPGRDLFDLIAFKQELEEGLGKVDVITERPFSDMMAQHGSIHSLVPVAGGKKRWLANTVKVEPNKPGCQA